VRDQRPGGQPSDRFGSIPDVQPQLSELRTGRVRGRYYRENFAQGGLELVQTIPELVTNADAAIEAGGRPHGRIRLSFAAPDPEFVRTWREYTRALRVPALRGWSHELRCTDDGVGVNAATVDARLGALGVTPDHVGQRGLFGRGLRDVWLAQGAGRIQGVRDGRAVESWFFPAPGDDPYAFVHVRDAPTTEADLLQLDVDVSGTEVTVPLATTQLPPWSRLRSLVGHLVQLRPVLEDLTRELWLELPGAASFLVTDPSPEPDPQRPVLFDGEVVVAGGISAQIVVWRSASAIPLSPQRATRRGGLLIRSGRAAHETTLVGHESRPGARHLFGEVRCAAIEELQRDALESPRPQVVVKVDRSGLNEHHPMVQRLYAAIDRVVRPIVEAEERRAGAHRLSATKPVAARDAVGLRAINDVLKRAFDSPGSRGLLRGTAESKFPPSPPDEGQPGASEHREPLPRSEEETEPAVLRFARSPLRLHPGEQRGASLLIDPARVAPGTAVTITSDRGIAWRPWGEAVVPAPQPSGWSRLSGTVRARVTTEPGSRLTITAQADTHSAALEVLIVRHRAAGWVREIARKDEDAEVEAEFDPETGVVTVYEGRKEFRTLERAARRAGFSKRRIREYLPYRMLEVEVAANAVYAWAAREVIAQRVGEHATDGPAYAEAVRLEAQALRYRAHDKLMRAFLEPEVFEGGVRVDRAERPDVQASLLDDN
jgi:hypothetical protein